MDFRLRRKPGRFQVSYFGSLIDQEKYPSIEGKIGHHRKPLDLDDFGVKTTKIHGLQYMFSSKKTSLSFPADFPSNPLTSSNPGHILQHNRHSCTHAIGSKADNQQPKDATVKASHGDMSQKCIVSFLSGFFKHDDDDDDDDDDIGLSENRVFPHLGIFKRR